MCSGGTWNSNRTRYENAYAAAKTTAWKTKRIRTRAPAKRSRNRSKTELSFMTPGGDAIIDSDTQKNNWERPPQAELDFSGRGRWRAEPEAPGGSPHPGRRHPHDEAGADS